MKNLYLKKILSYGIVIVIFYFVFKTLFEKWESVKFYELDFNYYFIVLSAIFFLSSGIVMPVIWRSIAITLMPSANVSKFTFIKAFAYSLITRYVPGKIWQYAGQAYMVSNKGIPMQTIMASVAYDMILSTISACFFSILLIVITMPFDIGFRYYLITLIAILVGGFVIWRQGFFRLINFILVRMQKPPIPSSLLLKTNNVAYFLIYYCGAYLLSGAGFFFMAKAIADVDFNLLFNYIGIYVFATAMGTLAIILPAGLGLQESLIVVLLRSYLPVSIATIISLLARVWSIFLGIVLFCIIWLISQLKYFKD